MKIAYMNPWENAAENQAYRSLSAAAAKLGVELSDCRIAEDIERIRPDFVISVASSIPKAADYPTYLTLHEPRRRFLESEFYLQNLLSYDGFFTVSDRLERFARDICFGVARQTDVGFYYNTPQRSEMYADIPAAVRDYRLRIGYFGTNWDRRMPALFQALDQRSILRIHGPAASWSTENYQSYAGPLPFDGTAPQKAYATYGMGLVLLSADHLRDDLISNRIFEITSVGALAICPETPWIRRWFGDSVLYYHPGRSTAFIAGQITRHFEFCKNAPAVAQAMGEHARRIFEQHFCADKMLQNAIAYHETLRDNHKKRREARSLRPNEPPQPEISVIVRCGGRSIETLQAAVDSIRRQTFGRYTVIFSRYRPLDLHPITATASDRIMEFMELFTPDGDRQATLLAGLRAVRTEYFAILDDDDFWLSDHIESLFSSAAVADPSFDVVFSGTVCVDQVGTQIERALSWNRNIYTFGFRKPPQSETEIAGEFASNCFVARSDLIPSELCGLPTMETAEDSFVVALITRRKRPVFSFKATAFFRRGRGDESNFTTLLSRPRDLLSMRLRTSLLRGSSWFDHASVQPAMEAWREFMSNNPEPPSPTDTLGVPKLDDDLSESWELIERMSEGSAGQRISNTEFQNRKGVEGHVCYGPYIALPVGRYRIGFGIKLPALRLPGRRGGLGTMDVICTELGWEGAARSFTTADRRISAEFEVPETVAGKPLEFRLWSSGVGGFSVTSVRLNRYE